MSSVATAPTVYGIETRHASTTERMIIINVATAPTVYGIETSISNSMQEYCLRCNSTYRLRY